MCEFYIHNYKFITEESLTVTQKVGKIGTHQNWDTWFSANVRDINFKQRLNYTQLSSN